MTTRLVQLVRGGERRIAVVDEPNLRLLTGFISLYGLAGHALATRTPLTSLVAARAKGETLDYDAVYHGRSEWSLLAPIDHPEPARCLVSGTGLTHLGSAAHRHAMNAKEAELTDSMRMFRLGLEGGRPVAGTVGTSPEWFHKGNGTLLRGHGEPLSVPPYGEDGGEEGEIAGVYMIGADGAPWRVGMCIGNEFSDHVIEKKNYLYLAGSKLRMCSLGPELVVDPRFSRVPGTVTVERAGAALWSKDVCTGETEMCHSLVNMEHHHFKYESHRTPGDVHVHYFGACGISFGDGVRLADGDVMQISFEGFGRPLRNPLRVELAAQALVTVQALA